MKGGSAAWEKRKERLVRAMFKQHSITELHSGLILYFSILNRLLTAKEGDNA